MNTIPHVCSKCNYKTSSILWAVCRSTLEFNSSGWCSTSAPFHTSVLFLFKLLNNNAFKRNKAHFRRTLSPEVPHTITLLQIPALCVVRRPAQAWSSLCILRLSYSHRWEMEQEGWKGVCNNTAARLLSEASPLYNWGCQQHFSSGLFLRSFMVVADRQPQGLHPAF